MKNEEYILHQKLNNYIGDERLQLLSTIKEIIEYEVQKQLKKLKTSDRGQNINPPNTLVGNKTS